MAFAGGGGAGEMPALPSAESASYVFICLMTVTLAVAQKPSRSALRCEVVAPCVTTTRISSPAAAMRASSRSHLQAASPVIGQRACPPSAKTLWSYNHHACSRELPSIVATNARAASVSQDTAG